MKTSNNNMLEGTNHKVSGLHLILELNLIKKAWKRYGVDAWN